MPVQIKDKKNLHLLLLSESKVINENVSVYKNFDEVTTYIGTLKNTFEVFCDMDGVLLCDDFRHENQSKNLYISLLKNGIVDDSEIYSQKFPLNLIPSELDIKSMNKFKGNLIIVSGASGAGKSSVISEVLLRSKNVGLVPRLTTRNKRYSEQYNSAYDFINEYSFKNLISSNKFIEYGYFSPGFYGTLFDDLIEKFENYANVIYEADPVTALFVAEKLKKLNIVNIKTVFIRAGDVYDRETVKNRILSRSELAENDYDLNGRIKKSEDVLKFINKFDTVITNVENEFENTVLEFERLLIIK